MSPLPLIVWLLILGFLAWLVEKAPIISPTFKTFIVYALIIVGAAMLLSFIVDITGLKAFDFKC